MTTFFASFRIKLCAKPTRHLTLDRALDIFIGKTKKNRDLSQEVVDLGIKYINRLKIQYLTEFWSPVFRRKFYHLNILVNEFAGNLDEAINWARKGYYFFSQLPYDYIKPKIVFLLHITNSYIRLGNFPEAGQVIGTSLKIQSVGDHNWFMGMWMYTQLSIITKEYDAAVLTYNNMVSTSSFDSQKDDNKQYIFIMGFYLKYITTIDQSVTKKIENMGCKSISMEEMPEFDILKSRINAPILIISFAFKAFQSKYKDMTKIASELSKYRPSRYSKKTPQFRTYTFIKLINNIVDGNFNKAAISRKNNNFLEQLKASQFRITEQKQALEIIPYEALWEMVIVNLKTPKRLARY